MENVVNAGQPADPNFNKNSVPIRWGVMLAILNCILFTVAGMFFAKNVFSYFIIIVIFFILIIILMGVGAAQQRKAMGGYITFKEAFRAIFIMILFVAITGFIFGLIYLHYIDPDFMIKMKQNMLTSMEKYNLPQEKVDEAARNFDKETADRNTVNGQVLSLLKTIIFYSIGGFICAAIVKRNKPLV